MQGVDCMGFLNYPAKICNVSTTETFCFNYVSTMFQCSESWGCGGITC